MRKEAYRVLEWRGEERERRERREREDRGGRRENGDRSLSLLPF